MLLDEEEHGYYKLKCDFLHHFDHPRFDAHANGQMNRNGALVWAARSADWSVDDALNSETEMGLRVWPEKLNENEYEPE